MAKHQISSRYDTINCLASFRNKKLYMKTEVDKVIINLPLQKSNIVLCFIHDIFLFWNTVFFKLKFSLET